MAGDWIKMRVWLSKDPKVISMSDFLARDREFMNWLSDPVRRTCTESAYEHVTRNVTVALCVTGLLVTWGTAREQGDRENDDLTLAFCRISTIDAMTDIPGFGEAMASVGWAEERENEVLAFPNFFKDNESPDDRYKRQNAERQAKHREKRLQNSNVTSNAESNVTVTHREEKRRDKDIPVKSTGKKPGKVPLPDDWMPSERTIQKLSAEFGFSNGDAERYIAAFKDMCAAHGYKYEKFDAAFSNCVRQDWPKFRNGATTMPKHAEPNRPNW